MAITINELLRNRGLEGRVKFVRQKTNGTSFIIKGVLYEDKTLYEMYKESKEVFLDYQRQVGGEDYKDVDYIVSFLGEEGTRSRFIGVYKVGDVSVIESDGINYLYEMEEVLGAFDDLKERVIVNWGVASSTRSWQQWMNKPTGRNNILVDYKIKEVIEICSPLDYVQFTDYLSVIIKRKELEWIFESDNSGWKKALTAINCIYLITDTKTGLQYVGSTYNATEGMWSRWRGYYKTIHNTNKYLEELVAPNGEVYNDDYKDHFQYSILQILSKSVSKNEALKFESLHKDKLGSRAFGLNGN